LDKEANDPFASIHSTVIPDRYVVVVTGSRDATTDRDWHVIFNVLDRAHRDKPITLIVQGGARGADAVAAEWAKHNDVRVMEYVADWKTQGRSAGPIRNRLMIREQKPDVVIGFSNKPLEQSKGTKSCLQIAGEQGVPTHLFRTDTGTREF
jgi:hypothetical protein